MILPGYRSPWYQKTLLILAIEIGFTKFAARLAGQFAEARLHRLPYILFPDSSPFMGRPKGEGKDRAGPKWPDAAGNVAVIRRVARGFQNYNYF